MLYGKLCGSAAGAAQAMPTKERAIAAKDVFILLGLFVCLLCESWFKVEVWNQGFLV